jgi:hypothetical protein
MHDLRSVIARTYSGNSGLILNSELIREPVFPTGEAKQFSLSDPGISHGWIHVVPMSLEAQL